MAGTCKHRNTHFSRVLCACDSMHNYCNDCGKTMDDCPYDEDTHLLAVAEARMAADTGRRIPLDEVLRRSGIDRAELDENEEFRRV